MKEQQFNRGLDFLKSKGLNLVAIFGLDELPEALRASLKASGVEMVGYRRLVLLGHAGRSLWDRLTDENRELFDTEDPVDLYSRQIVEKLVSDYWGEASSELLYPGDSPVPLQQFGEMAGWHYDSPMGIGINKEHGLWFAYRALLLVDADLPLRHELQTVSPCQSCLDSPCISACPAKALIRSQMPNLDCCIRFRVKDASPCKDRCLARECCPVAVEKRYDREQISYHYLCSLSVIQAYYY